MRDDASRHSPPSSPKAAGETHSDAFYRLLVDSVQEYAIFLLDPAGRVATWNAGARRIKGYEAAEIIGRPLSVFYAPDEVSAGKPELAVRTAREHGRFVDEGWRVRKDGSRFWASVVLAALHDGDGTLVGLAKITRDLSDRRAADHRALEDARRLAHEEAGHAAAKARAAELADLLDEMQAQAAALEDQASELEEQATALEAANRELLQESRRAEAARDDAQRAEARYRLLFQHNPMPMWVYEHSTLRILAANDAALAQYGYSRDEFLALTIADIRPPEDVPRLREVIAAHASELNRSSGWRHRRKDGSLVDVEIIAYPVEFDGRPAALVLANDVTQRVRAEEDLRESTEFLQTVVDSSPAAIIASDADGRITRWNSAAQRILGWTAEEMQGRDQIVLAPPDRHQEYRDIRDHAVTTQVPSSVRTKRLRKDGSEVDVDLSIGAWCDARGIVRGYVTVMIDATERTRLETQLRQSQKMEAIGQLAGGVAHDFNNLLTVVTSCSELALSELPGDHAVRQDLEEIRNASRRAAVLTRHLLAFSRQQLLTPQAVELNSLVSDLQPMLRRVLREDIGIVTSLEPGPTTVMADPGQLEQVLLNLAVNARDAMPEGGTLTIGTARATHADATLHREGDAAMPPGEYVVLTVSDTGVGMTADVRSRIFEPFFTTKPAGVGTGLGLSTVYGIVKQSGGFIWVYSEPGRGTTFKTYLPHNTGAAANEVPAGPESAPAGRGETILVVEDDEPLRTLICRVLRGYRYTVLEARHGVDALEICAQRDDVVLVLSDMVMPEMSGVTLAYQMTRRHPSVTVMLMSGYTADTTAREAIASQQYAFLEKPFTPLKLALKVREVLDGRG